MSRLRMRLRPAARLAAVGVVAGLALAGAGTTAQADVPSPRAVVTVRTEGYDKTLFEGPILTRGHDIRATSDTETRRCDGTNNGAHEQPGPTPTAATVDGQTLVGRGFDALWYDGFGDYFVKQFGPDRENNDTSQWWGVLVNRTFTSVGGCQYRMDPDDAVLWIADAFGSRTPLRLDGPEGIGESTSAGEGSPSVAPVKSTFTVDLGAPLAVTARDSFDSYSPGLLAPAAGVDVAPVSTDPTTGDQTVLTDDPATVVTDGDGRASIRWSTPGWKRIKATSPNHIRSNRLDVCVRDAAGHDCGPLPADVQIRGLDLPTFGSDPVALGTVASGTLGAPTTVTLSNPDSEPLDVHGVQVVGAEGGDFLISSETCSDAPVPAKGSCTVTVRFSPSASGPREATLRASLTGLRLAPSVTLEGQGGTLPQGERGTTGTVGPQGDSGVLGPQGAVGAVGTTGAKGATGARGPHGRDAVCRVGATRKGRTTVTCTVTPKAKGKTQAGKARERTVAAKLTRQGRVYATGSSRGARTTLGVRAGRRLAPGAYYLRTGSGRTATSQRVTLR